MIKDKKIISFKNSEHFEINNRLRVCIYSHLSIIDSVIHLIRNTEKDQIVKDVVCILFQSVGSSAHSIFKISDQPDLIIKDCFIVLRSVVETSINLALILSDNSYATKAHDHALHRTAHRLKRKKTFGSWTFETEHANADAFKNRPDVVAACLKFKKEKSPWTEENLPQKLEKIEKKFGSCVQLSAAYYSIYDESSELIHGSYFGIINFYDFNKPAEEDLEKIFLIKQTEILFHTISCLNKIIVICNENYELEKQKSLSNDILDLAVSKIRILFAFTEKNGKVA